MNEQITLEGIRKRLGQADRVWAKDDIEWLLSELTALRTEMEKYKGVLQRIASDNYWYDSFSEGDGYEEPHMEGSGCNKCGGGFEHGEANFPSEEVEHEPDCCVAIAAAALSEELDAIRPETNFEPQAEEEDSDR